MKLPTALYVIPRGVLKFAEKCVKEAESVELKQIKESAEKLREYGKFNDTPPKTQTVSEWAERKRVIGKGLTANPGPFEFYLIPYLREIADCLSDNSPILEVYVIKATQVGFTGTTGPATTGYPKEFKTLRDEIAIAAMQGFISLQVSRKMQSMETMAKWAYEQADAMLEARNK